MYAEDRYCAECSSSLTKDETGTSCDECIEAADAAVESAALDAYQAFGRSL